MQTILVLGATGLLGAYSTLHFHNLGYKVIAVGHRRSGNGFFADYGIPYYSINLEEPESFDVIPQGGGKNRCSYRFCG